MAMRMVGRGTAMSRFLICKNYIKTNIVPRHLSRFDFTTVKYISVFEQSGMRTTTGTLAHVSMDKKHLNSHCFSTSSSTSSKSAAAEKPSTESESVEMSSSQTSESETVEKPTGEAEKREFQAETRMLLQIVAKSLYSETEIFIRELISNASDALSKFRYLNLSGEVLDKQDRALEIRISTDKMARTLTIQDTGIGMTKDEMIANLGMIARSGSKAFLEKIKESGSTNDSGSIIGQFGVGFYSSFMVATKVDVYSRSAVPESKGYKWSSDGTGSYEIQEADGVKKGTKIIVHLKTDCRQFSDDETVSGIVKKYSNFIGSPILLNGKQLNTIEALWLKQPKDVEPHLHHDFYRFIAHAVDRPRFILHFKTDVPLSLSSVLYVPEAPPGMFENQASVGVALYSRNVLIKHQADNIIPFWLRFLRGVVDSEDIPLNLSRELLQEGSVIKKLKLMVTNKILRFLYDKGQKDSEEYMKFYKDHAIFLKEGILSDEPQYQKEEIAKLLRFETSNLPAGQYLSLPEYCKTMASGQKEIYYLLAPSREVAERSPYMESFREKGAEVIFCFENYDEIVLDNLGTFDGKVFSSVEKEVRSMPDSLDLDALPIGSLARSEIESMTIWLMGTLKGKADTVKFTQKLTTHPCVITVQQINTARRFLRSATAKIPADAKLSLLKPRLEVNIKHPIIKKLNRLRESNPSLATDLAEHLFQNAMVEAGLEDNSRLVLAKANELLMKTLHTD